MDRANLFLGSGTHNSAPCVGNSAVGVPWIDRMVRVSILPTVSECGASSCKLRASGDGGDELKIEHEELVFQETTTEGSQLGATLESWTDPANGRTMRRLYGAHHHLILPGGEAETAVTDRT